MKIDYLALLKNAPKSGVDRMVDQFTRLNDNFERYLAHIGARPLTEPTEKFQSYVGEPLNEVEMALKEHAELTGQDWKREDDEQV